MTFRPVLALLLLLPLAAVPAQAHHADAGSCTTNAQPIVPGQTEIVFVASGQWRWYRVHAFYVTVMVESAVGDLDLRVVQDRHCEVLGSSVNPALVPDIWMGYSSYDILLGVYAKPGLVLMDEDPPQEPYRVKYTRNAVGVLQVAGA